MSLLSPTQAVLISSPLFSLGVLARDFNHRMDEMISTVKPWIKDGGLNLVCCFDFVFVFVCPVVFELYRDHMSLKYLVCHIYFF